MKLFAKIEVAIDPRDIVMDSKEGYEESEYFSNAMLGNWVSGALPRAYNLQVVHYYKMIDK